MPRVLEIFRLAKANIVERIPRDQVLSEVVITGGGAHLRGIETTAAEVFGLPVRIGVPSTMAGLTDAVKQPEYATAVGLVLFGPRGEQTPHLNGHSSGGFALSARSSPGSNHSGIDRCSRSSPKRNKQTWLMRNGSCPSTRRRSR